ncbi:MAG: alpha/beta fold hydrolase [Synechococcus sp.]|nr:alpha/beta fold hydrolase [Synechococcus sp.]
MLLSLPIEALPGPAGIVTAPARAAQQLQLQLDDLEIPLDLDQLERWSRSDPRPAASRHARAATATATAAAAADPAPDPIRAGRPPFHADQDIWLDLLEPETRQTLIRLLRAPLLRDGSFGHQLLDSWTGTRMLAELGALLTTPDGRSTAPLLQTTLREQLQQHREVTLLSLLRALPVARVQLRIDGLLSLAAQWRRQIQQQRHALAALARLGLPQRNGRPQLLPDPRLRPQRSELRVAHRREPLPVDLWPARGARAGQRPWLLVLPGLGGNADQLSWLAACLAQRGWSVAVPQHPGSDGPALRAALEGRSPPPGAETLVLRLQDVAALLAARQRGQLLLPGDGVVLVGHSLGGLTALLVAGAEPQRGLAERCRRAIDRLPLGNPSRLLQCELVQTGVPAALSPPPDLRGLMLFNSFGSLLWPHGAMASLPQQVPVLMVGGSLDLVTPPLEEQLRLFLPAGNPASRLVLLEGGSHFSPLRLVDQGEAVLRLGRDLVGVDPGRAQNLLLALSLDFLQLVREPLALPAQLRSQEGIRAYVLDGAAASRWQALSRP